MNKRKWFLVVVVIFNLGYLYYIASKPNITPEEAAKIVSDSKGQISVVSEKKVNNPQWKFIDGKVSRVYEVNLEEGNKKIYVNAKTGTILLEEGAN